MQSREIRHTIERNRQAPAPRAVAEAIEAWFPAAARELPWRTKKRDAYHSLVAEAMLQQTQVSRIAERFPKFIARFPTVAHLAEANESEVLSLWSGLGYYRRAKNLHAAAKAIARDFGGVVPNDIDSLRRLPGVGRYTAGAIASIALGRREAIVDGNVRRVLLRLHAQETDPGSRETADWAWEQAEELVHAAADPAVLNEGLMELGATVCTPAAPRCDACPLAGVCAALALDKTGSIPRPLARATREEKAVITCDAAVVLDAESGRVLVERRGDRGMWAGLWQAVTLEARGSAGEGRAQLASAIGLAPEGLSKRPVARFEHQTSHRLVVFRVWKGALTRKGGKGVRPRRGRWMRVDEALALGLSSPQRRILELAAKYAGQP